jgi:hypothetical protein
MTEHEARAREIVLRAGKCREDDALSYFDHLCDGIASALKEQAETIARLREALTEIAALGDDYVYVRARGIARAALSGNIPDDPA